MTTNLPSNFDTAAKLKRLVNRAVREALDVGIEMHAWVLLRGNTWVVRWKEGEKGKPKRQRQKSCGKGATGKALAEKLRRQIDAELELKKKALSSSKPWGDFVKEYMDRILSGRAEATRRQARLSFGNFERHVGSVTVDEIDTAMVDLFTSKRRRDIYRDHPIAPASVNADLRQLKAAFKVAWEWKYMAERPRIRMEREMVKLPRYVPPEHFDLIYQACDTARLASPQWWRALFVFLYCTGWRIGETLSLKRAGVDLERGLARVDAEHTKGRREAEVDLHPVVIAHFKQIEGFSEYQFDWPHDITALARVRREIMRAAGTPVYGFHDFRRAFGTLNASKMPPRVLQHLMRHQSGQTTQRYYQNPLASMKDVVAQLYVPKAAGG